MKEELAIGVVGAGGFASFAAGCFCQVPGIKVVAVTDTNIESARTMAIVHHAEVYNDYALLLRDQRVDLVYIATPPFLHFIQSKMALLAGKHVICEKPAALITAEAEELVNLAKDNQLLYAVNLMQRYNPLYNGVKEIITENLLGDFLHGFFENYASDEKLTPEHWFWDEAKSGGIFIEHGVHFFDLFSGWFGRSEVIHAAQWERKDFPQKIIDRVQATVLYSGGPVTFYHGFDQPKLLDRQEMRLQFERGDITLYEWVPVKIRIHGLLSNKDLELLKSIVKAHSCVVDSTLRKGNKKVRGRFKGIFFNELVTLEHGSISEKKNRYQQILVSMIKDQWKWIQDHSHVRITDGQNAVESLRVAERATQMAHNLSIG